MATVAMVTKVQNELPAMIIFVFFNFLAFWPLPWQWQQF
jgi:hypothetical protein